jgi:two-component system phosphate regulon response regulator PhoB
VRETPPDVIILDWMLPNVSGIEVCRQLKMSGDTARIPVIMLSARSEETDKVRGLETGADDYIVKPYSVAELLARLRTQLRRIRPASVGERLEFEDIVVDLAEHRVFRDGVSLSLGPTEFRLADRLHGTPRPGLEP